MCKKWYELIKDEMLWTKIDLVQYKQELNLKNLKQIIQNYGCASTKQFRLSGNLSQDKVLASSTNIIIPERDHSLYDDSRMVYYLDVEFFSTYLVQKACPKLTHVYLEHVDLSQISFHSFYELKNVNTLSLKWCYMDNAWFRKGDNVATKSTECSSSLKHLYLIRSSSDQISHSDIEQMCIQMPHLTTLSITQTKSSLNDDHVDLIAKLCAKLECLELINTLINDNAIYSICTSKYLSKNLKHLNLSMSSSLSNTCLTFIGEHLKNLKSLHLTSCFGISNIKLFENLHNLNYLNLNNTSLDRNKIKEHLLPMLPKCEIEYGHEKMLNRKLMWTINGSRNCVCSF